MAERQVTVSEPPRPTPADVRDELFETLMANRILFIWIR